MEGISFLQTEVIRKKMNLFGLAGKAFLFGLNFELTEGFFVENPLEQDFVCFSVGEVSNSCSSEAVAGDFVFQKFPISFAGYRHKFELVHRGLKRGNSFLTNLTVKTPVVSSLSLPDIYARSRSPYRLLVPGRFVCFSPERFVKIENGVISSNPMKGTADASLPDAQSLILNDFKETAEHCTIVDLIRNDLSSVADDVEVRRFRYIEKIDTSERSILQVSSEIEGMLASDWSARLGDILFGLLPAGSVTGAPKDATLKLIREAELENRGYYCGVFGYFDGKMLDSSVMIRFIETDSAGQMYYRSGGGITAYSDCRSEYEEVLNKIYLPFKV